jgi:hypothetical protein
MLYKFVFTAKVRPDTEPIQSFHTVEKAKKNITKKIGIYFELFENLTFTLYFRLSSCYSLISRKYRKNTNLTYFKGCIATLLLILKEI